MKGMENYKKTLKDRIALVLILCVLALLAMMFGVFYLKERFPGQEHITDYVIGFFTGLEFAFVFLIGYYYRVMRDEKLMRAMFLKENDERQILIRMKSGIKVVSVLSILIIIASLPVAYLSYEAFVAMMIVAFTQLIFSGLLKLYWLRKL
ncbi:MAG: hypothetical protein Q4P30_02905 [Eubacteriales bacterium]|nr:hypothetical protein [Eubacteriales bacterium]